MTAPLVCKSRDALASLVHGWKAEGYRIGLVPTMGALHAGHLSLVEAVAPNVDKIIVSIFVNPSQFGPDEDFDQYPRTLEGDLAALEQTSAGAVYAPRVKDIYPAGFDCTVVPGSVARRFEGAERPGHFEGVATVVTKLILQSAADVAIFGEKDFQQLAVLNQVARDLDLPVKILGAPIMREADGLAMSSRNRYLSESERKIAGNLNVQLHRLIESVRDGAPFREAESACEQALLAVGFTAVDYVRIIDPATLEDTGELGAPAHVLAVARVGSVRLLDNMRVI